MAVDDELGPGLARKFAQLSKFQREHGSLGLDLPETSIPLMLHVGQETVNMGNVALSIAPLEIEREKLGALGFPIIALHPDKARLVAAQIVLNAEAAEAFRRDNEGG